MKLEEKTVSPLNIPVTKSADVWARRELAFSPTAASLESAVTAIAPWTPPADGRNLPYLPNGSQGIRFEG